MIEILWIPPLAVRKRAVRKLAVFQLAVRKLAVLVQSPRGSKPRRSTGKSKIIKNEDPVLEDEIPLEDSAVWPLSPDHCPLVRSEAAYSTGDGLPGRTSGALVIEDPDNRPIVFADPVPLTGQEGDLDLSLTVDQVIV